MGKRNSKFIQHFGGAVPDTDINFDSFEILRAIGRGAFGKVCLAERKLDRQVMAMKYVNKQLCRKQDAFQNIREEVELLRTLDHPFIVSLWYTFQDAEDLFIILEPLLGGDLRFHLNGGEHLLSEEQVRFICAEIGCALDYLKTKSIIHRDVKPDNILLDDWGHAHLTDFNVATRSTSETPMRTLAGTKPYMAPEMFACAANHRSHPGYSFSVDWWSLGVTAYELLSGHRPYDIHSKTSLNSILNLLGLPINYPDKWSPEFTKFLQTLLQVRPEQRAASIEAIRCQKLMANINFNTVLAKKLPPPFVPDSESLNCDPTYELEEMIVESRPLHKKKKRLLRQQSLLTQGLVLDAQQQQQAASDLGGNLPQINEDEDGPPCPSQSPASDDPFGEFPNYNREWERYQDKLKEKERLWEAELKRLMEASNVEREEDPLPGSEGDDQVHGTGEKVEGPHDCCPNSSDIGRNSISAPLAESPP